MSTSTNTEPGLGQRRQRTRFTLRKVFRLSKVPEAPESQENADPDSASKEAQAQEVRAQSVGPRLRSIKRKSVKVGGDGETRATLVIDADRGKPLPLALEKSLPSTPHNMSPITITMPVPMSTKDPTEEDHVQNLADEGIMQRITDGPVTSRTEQLLNKLGMTHSPWRM